MDHHAPAPRVGLFVTCLVDLFRPTVGFATVKLLEDAGCRVEVPAAQTCCGLPAFNSGDRATARDIARQVVAAFEGFDHVVVPSGSCAAHVKLGVPELLADDGAWAERARAVAARTWELTAFLTEVCRVSDVSARLEVKATYHDSCSGLRRLGIREQPRRLLDSVEGLDLVELEPAEECCGFGGTFAVKYPDISNRMVEEKADAIESTGADLLLGGDMGCLLNIAGKLSRRRSRVKVRHVAEVLAGMTGDAPPIGEPAASDGGAAR